MRLVVAAVSASLLFACTNPSATEPAEPTGAAAQPIISGSASSADQDFVVELASRQRGSIYEECTGTLIARNLILTARHCVGELVDGTDVTNFAASALEVYEGRDAQKRIDSKAAPDAKGTKLFTTAGTKMVPDVALILLDRPVTGVPISKIRLDGGTKKGELLDVVGYGYDERGTEPAARMQRSGVGVVGIGPATMPTFAMIAGEFLLGEAACVGDSGGPALSADTHAVVGVVSRVYSDTQATAADPVAYCRGAGAQSVYTTLAPVKDLVLEAFAAAGTQPYLETDTAPPPDPDAADPASTPSDGADDSAPAQAPARRLASTPASSSGCRIGRAPNAAGDAESSIALVAAFGVVRAMRRFNSRRRAPR